MTGPAQAPESRRRAILVRRSRAADAPALSTIALAIVTAYGLSPDPDLLRYGENARAIELVAEVDGEIAGTVTLSMHPHDTRAGWVSKLFVDPLARGGGIGRALLDAVIARAHDLDLDWLELSTLEVFHAAIHVYESSGWQRRPFRARNMERRYVRQLRS